MDLVFQMHSTVGKLLDRSCVKSIFSSPDAGAGSLSEKKNKCPLLSQHFSNIKDSWYVSFFSMLNISLSSLEKVLTFLFTMLFTFLSVF